jgi:UDP-N-acetylglucosamine--N-acetylmuramyl-(pentapeptide) pyrophosphoryl-undecaprenol N-acetylglucosamine transferase
MGDALRARGHVVKYFGDGARLEGRVAAERGYEFRPVAAAQFPRAGLLAKLKFGFQLLAAVARTRALVKREGATLVLGVGGYVMAPTVLAAWTLGIPSAVHESNVSPGLANRLCAKVARLVLLTYDETRAKLPTKAEKLTVGCPVNPRILSGEASKYGLPADKPVLLVVGGSLGAATINALALAAAADSERSYSILHLTGPRYFDEVAAAYKALPGGMPPNLVVRPYEDRMGDAFAAASLVLARAGSSTLAEICAVGKPSFLVPSPNVTDNHQEANARGLEHAGAARVLVEKGLDVSAAVGQLRALMADESALAAMGAAAHSLAKPNVAEEVATLLLDRFGSGAAPGRP